MVRNSDDERLFYVDQAVDLSSAARASRIPLITQEFLDSIETYV